MDQSSRQRKNNWQGRQLVGAVCNGPGWQGIAGGEWCEHQGQKHCSNEVYQCSQKMTILWDRQKSLNTCFISKTKPAPRWTLLSEGSSNLFIPLTSVAFTQHQGKQLSYILGHTALQASLWCHGTQQGWFVHECCTSAAQNA